MQTGKQGLASRPSYGADGAVEREIARAMDVDVVVFPSFDLGRNQIARDAEEDGNERHVVKQCLLRVTQQIRARDWIALMVGTIDKGLERRTVVFAVVQVRR